MEIQGKGHMMNAVTVTLATAYLLAAAFSVACSAYSAKKDFDMGYPTTVHINPLTVLGFVMALCVLGCV